MHADAARLIELLGLVPHPEGGFYRETFRSTMTVGDLPHRASRNASTAIYHLIPGGGLSALHRVSSDEVWHHYDGDSVELHTFDPNAGEHVVTHLGHDYEAGERPQHIVPAGLWQAALVTGQRYALCGCTVAPGFDFADFEMPSRAELLARFPANRTLVELLTRN